MFQRGLTLLAGSAWGRPRALEPTDADVIVHMAGDATDGARVRDALRRLDDASVTTLFALSYEACAALDDRAPRKPYDERRGPDVLIRRVREVPYVDAKSTSRRVEIRAPAGDARARHVERVRRAHELLLDGVIYQANLAHTLEVAPMGFADALAWFAATTPVPPCAALVDVPGWGSIVSLSPERFVNVDGGVARAFPIKGTRPRGGDAAQDARLLAELCASEKDAAEHVMIVDLLRNDLGKVASRVTVEKLLAVMSVKNVHHLESTVAARLRPGTTTSSLLEATVPGGSITGAPKSSAIETICALEDSPRGLYTGVLGIVEGNTLRSSLLIRTWLRPDDGAGTISVGGGIVLDSDADAEWTETLDKAAAFSR